MKGENHQAELFGIYWQSREYPFRLRVNDLIRFDGRLCRVIRVTESAAVLLMNRPRRIFKTRFDKPVNFQPPPSTIRIAADSEIEVLNRPDRKPGKRKTRRIERNTL
jgi:RecB family endonuclease NucS